MKLKTTLIAAAAALVALPAAAADAAPTKQKFRFTATAYPVAENAGAVELTVTRQRKGKPSAVNGTAASINWSAADGSAQRPSDYNAQSGTLNFAACAGGAPATDPCQVQKIQIPIANDSVFEAPESFTVSLSNGGGQRNVLAFPSQASVVIADDDAPAAANPAFQLAAATDIVSEGAGSLSAFVVRSGNLDGAVSAVTLSTADGTATKGVDFNDPADTTIDFADGQVFAEVQIPVIDDGNDNEAGIEDFTVSLVDGAAYDLASPSSQTVSIVDNDDTPMVQFGAPTLAVSEGDIAARVPVFATGNVNQITADVATANGTAIAGSDYTAVVDTLDITNDGIPVEYVDVPISNDSADESDETFTIALSNVSGANLGSIGAATVTIVDNDTTPVVIEKPVEVPVEGPGETPAPQVTEVTNVTNVTNTTTENTTVVNNPFADEAGILVLGARVGGCRLSIGTFKAQRILRAKLVRVKLHAVEACTGSVKSHVKGRKSLRGVKKGALQTKVVKFSLKAGQSKTIKMRFTKRGYALLKRALGKQKTLNASLLVRSVNSAKRVTLTTRSWKAKR